MSPKSAILFCSWFKYVHTGGLRRERKAVKRRMPECTWWRRPADTSAQQRCNRRCLEKEEKFKYILSTISYLAFLSAIPMGTNNDEQTPQSAAFLTH